MNVAINIPYAPKLNTTIPTTLKIIGTIIALLFLIYLFLEQAIIYNYYQTKISVNRGNSLIQVPLYFNEKQKQDRVGWSKRCIYNGLNSDQNYYLMFAVLLYAGLYGIENKLGGIERIEVDAYTKEEMISDLEENTYFKEKLGEKLIQKAINKLKKGE